MKFFEQTYVKYALVMSAFTVACLLLMHVLGEKPGASPISFVLTFIIPLVIWYLGLQAKKKQQKGKLTFKQGVKEAFKISLFYGIISPFIFMGFYLLLNPSWIPFLKEAYQMKSASDTMIIAFDMAAQFVSAIIGGTIYGAIVSFFVKSK